MKTQRTACMALIAMAGAQSLAADRDVQFINIHTQAQILTIMNTGGESVDLSGWRFCTHNTSQVRRYSSSSGLNGVLMAPGTSITVHMANDADAGDSTQFNASDLGTFAPFEIEAYGLGIYFTNAQGNTPFSDGNFIADHLQWSLDGIDNTTADERSDEAEAGGVWIDQTQWISTSLDTQFIELTDLTFAELHGPSDYNVLGPVCLADLNGDGVLNFFDVSAFLSAFGSMDLAADFTGDGMLNFFDVSAFLSAFGAGCP